MWERQLRGIQRFDPAYVQIAEQLRNLIRQGEWREGQRIPSANKLATEFNVSTKTAHHAIKVLASEGLVRTEPKRGVFVQPSSEWTNTQ